MKVEVAALGSPSLIVRTVSVYRAALNYEASRVQARSRGGR